MKKLKTFLLTGVNRNGRRFRIATTTPWHYNILNGSLWLIDSKGKKKLLNRFYEGVKI